MKNLLRGLGWMVFFVILSLITPVAFKYTPGLSLTVLSSLVIGVLWHQTRSSTLA